jgi:hypothetical protein
MFINHSKTGCLYINEMTIIVKLIIKVNNQCKKIINLVKYAYSSK